MNDDMLKYAIETSRQKIDECQDFDADGLAVAEAIKVDRRCRASLSPRTTATADTADTADPQPPPLQRGSET